MPCSSCSALHGVNPNKKKTSQTKPVEFFLHLNQQATFCCSLYCLVDQVQVQKLILDVATDQMPDYT